MNKICVYIDGYNFYHALDRFSIKNNKKYEHYKWLNLYKLMQFYLQPTDKLVSIYYFSAYADWLPEASNRHKLYIKALESQGIKFIEGRFAEKEKHCKLCEKTSRGHEEKETDVSIGLYLLSDAYEDVFNKAILVSQDSDLYPVAKMMKEKFSDKKLKIITPLNSPHSGRVTSIVGKKERGMIQEMHVKQSLFDRKIKLSNGKIITRPRKYDPPISR